MLKDILEYQKKDSMLVKIDRDLENSQQKTEVNKLVEQVKQVQSKLVALENNAVQLVAEFEKVKQTFEKESKKLQKVKDTDFSDKEEAELRDAEVQIKKEIGGLLGFGKEIKALSNKITQTVKEFEKTKAFGVECKDKYKASFNKYKQFSTSKTEEKQKILAELEELKKRIDPKIMNKYLHMRDDHKFPILVPLVNQSCGGCAMNLPNARYDLLKKNHFLECENCHRIIYLPEDVK